MKVQLEFTPWYSPKTWNSCIDFVKSWFFIHQHSCQTHTIFTSLSLPNQPYQTIFKSIFKSNYFSWRSVETNTKTNHSNPSNTKPTLTNSFYQYNSQQIHWMIFEIVYLNNHTCSHIAHCFIVCSVHSSW